MTERATRRSISFWVNVSFGAVFLVILVGGGVALTWFDGTYAGVNRRHAAVMMAATGLAEAQSALWQLRWGMAQFATGDAQAQRLVLGEEPRHQVLIERALADDYERVLTDDEARLALGDLRAKYQRYKEASGRFFQLWQEGRHDAAGAWLAGTVTPYGDETVRAFDRQIALLRPEATRASTREAALATQMRLVFIGMAFVVIVMLAARTVAARRALGPLRALRVEAAALVRDRLGEEVQLDTTGNEIDALTVGVRLMAERLLAHAESLRQSRERLDFLLGATSAIIFSLRGGGDFAQSFMSANVRDVLGYAPEDFLRDPGFFASKIHPDDRERVLGWLAASEEQGTHADEYRFRHQDGSWRWMRVVTRQMPTASGAPQELVGYWIDITDRHRAEVALQDALRAKSEFMSSVTHELRTPLNSIIGFAELLLDEVSGPLNTKQAAFAADILASGQHLLALVEGILEISRLDALEREPVAIGAALGECVAAHREAAAARGIAIQLDVATDVGSAELDPKALRRMFDPLLDNAIRFNRDGGMVAVRARRDGGWLQIAVADTGIGIAREDLAQLFKPLAQIASGLARPYGGLGLGLALAHQLAERHGGTIEVESEPGTGSTFTLRVPLWEGS